jgi:hypothetical protein
MSSEKSRKGFFFHEGGRGEPPYPPYHKKLWRQEKSFNANFPEKHLANHSSGAYAVRMKNEIKVIFQDSSVAEIELKNGTCVWFRRDQSKISISRNGGNYQNAQWDALTIEEQNAIDLFA